jgi:hypothetical protein
MVRSLACGAQFPAAVPLHMRHHPARIGVFDRMKNGAHVTPATEETRVDLRAAREVTPPW